MSNQLPINNGNGNNADEDKQNAKASIVLSNANTAQYTPAQDDAPKSVVAVGVMPDVKYKLWSEYPEEKIFCNHHLQ